MSYTEIKDVVESMKETAKLLNVAMMVPAQAPKAAAYNTEYDIQSLCRLGRASDVVVVDYIDLLETKPSSTSYAKSCCNNVKNNIYGMGPSYYLTRGTISVHKGRGRSTKNIITPVEVHLQRNMDKVHE